MKYHVLIHRRIHRRTDDLGRFGREIRRGEHIVRDPVRYLTDKIRRRGCDDDDLTALREGDVLDLPLSVPTKHIRHDGIMRECLEGHSGYELPRVLRHQDVYVTSHLDESADEVTGFIGGDPARNSYEDLFLHYQSLVIFTLPS